jgi:hypothetical protein
MIKHFAVSKKDSNIPTHTPVRPFTVEALIENAE